MKEQRNPARGYSVMTGLLFQFLPRLVAEFIMLQILY